MLQLIERRDGAPRIRRPRLQNVPPRRVARPLLVAVGLLALTIAGMWAGLRVSGPTYQRDTEAKLHVMIDDIWLEFRCRIAHVRAMSGAVNT